MYCRLVSGKGGGAKMIRGCVAFPPGHIMPEVFGLTVDFGSPFEDWVAAGNYSFRNSDINAVNFPSAGTGRVAYEGRLLSVGCGLYPSTVEKAIRDSGSDSGSPWIPTRIGPLLAFGAAFPEVQRDFMVIGLYARSIIGSTDMMAVLDERRGMRRLQLRWLPVLSERRSLYLAVRKLDDPRKVLFM